MSLSLLPFAYNFAPFPKHTPFHLTHCHASVTLGKSRQL